METSSLSQKTYLTFRSTCRVCDSGTVTPIFTLPSQPIGAWAFDNRTVRDIVLYQCGICGLVQLMDGPVPYWREDIRSIYPERCYLPGDWFPDSEVDEDYVYLQGPARRFITRNRLEHFPNPMSFLTGVHNNLHPGGHGTVEVPNFDFVLREKMFLELTFDHLSYFQKSTLEHTLSRAGFNAFVQEINGGYGLEAVVTKRGYLDLGEWSGKMESMVSVLSALTRGKRVAVYGAGHQATAFLSLIRECVEYVVDDTPSKQGRRMPGTDVPISPPTRLVDEPVDMVIVACGSWSDEVAKKVLHPEVYILRSYGLEKCEQR